MPLKEQLLQLEERLLQPEIRVSKEELVKLLAADFFRIWELGKSLI